jgi:hypothetical protein
MPTSFDTTTRNEFANALVTRLGANAVMRAYNGTKPAAQGAVTSQTLMATLTFGTTVTAANGGTAGGVTGGVLTFGGFTQSNGSHVAGTPTWVRYTQAGGGIVIDIDVGAGSTNLQWPSPIVTGQNITGSLVMTMPNAA